MRATIAIRLFVVALALICGAAGTSAAAGSAKDDFVERTLVHLSGGRPQISTVRVPRARQQGELRARAAATSHARAAASPAAPGQAVTAAIAPDAGCAASSLWLLDKPLGQLARHEICLTGIGTLDLRRLPRGPSSTWAGAVRSFWASSDPGLLAHTTCASIKCPAQRVKPFAQENASLAGKTADEVALYRLRPFPRTWDGVHQFVVADTNMKKSDIAAMLAQPAPVDFVWSADTSPACWTGDTDHCRELTQVGPLRSAPIIGHYQGLNCIGAPFFARCTVDSDCLLPGYVCQPLEGESWVVNSFVGPNHGRREPVCQVPRQGARPQACTAASASSCDRTRNYPGGHLVLPGSCVDSGLEPCGAGDRACTCQLSFTQREAIEYRYWHDRHPGWLLYSKPVDRPDGLAWAGGFGKADCTPMDITNPAVRAEIVGRIKRWKDIARYGALSVDLVFLANHSGAHYTCPNAKGCVSLGHAPGPGWVVPVVRSSAAHRTLSLNGLQRFDPIGCPQHHGYCDPAWTLLVTEWLSRLRDEAHKLNLAMVVNVGYGGGALNPSRPYVYIPPSDAHLAELFELADGVLDEGGFTQGLVPTIGTTACGSTWTYNGSVTCGATEPQERWSIFGNGRAGAPLGYMRAVQALGKPYFNKNASPSEGIPKVPGAQAISWSLASHLLARGPSEALAALAIYMGDDTNSSTDWGFIEPGGVLYQQLTPAIGHPCEDQQTAGANVFTRRYSGGFVVVNANAPGSELVSVTLPENGVFQGPQSVTVPPETGVVVLSAPGHPLCP